jgi:hypothetical protein
VTAAALLAKRTMDLTTSPLLQAGLALVLREGSYDRHLRRVVKSSARRLAPRARPHLPEGSSVGARADSCSGDAARAIDWARCRRARTAGVVYAPGERPDVPNRRASPWRRPAWQVPAMPLAEVARRRCRAGRSSAPARVIHACAKGLR